jgi:hypothetical protein
MTDHGRRRGRHRAQEVPVPVDSALQAWPGMLRDWAASLPAPLAPVDQVTRSCPDCGGRMVAFGAEDVCPSCGLVAPGEASEARRVLDEELADRLRAANAWAGGPR